MNNQKKPDLPGSGQTRPGGGNTTGWEIIQQNQGQPGRRFLMGRELFGRKK
jgi:hypothetical protein